LEIQQHDGVVVDVAGLGRASPSFCERERCSRGGGRRPRLLCYCPPSPLYIGPLGERIRGGKVQALPGDEPDRLWFGQGSDVLWLPVVLNPVDRLE